MTQQVLNKHEWKVMASGNIASFLNGSSQILDVEKGTGVLKQYINIGFVEMGGGVIGTTEVGSPSLSNDGPQMSFNRCLGKRPSRSLNLRH